MYTHARGGTPKMEFIYKNCVFILTCLNFSHLQSPLHLMQFTHWDFFFTAQNSFWTPRFWCLLVLLPFSPTSFTLAKCFPLRTFFIQGNKIKVAQGEIGWIERVGRGVMLFLVKNCWTLRAVWAGALVNHPSWNGQMYWKNLQKKCHWSWTQLLTTPAGTWYRGVPKTLT